MSAAVIRPSADEAAAAALPVCADWSEVLTAGPQRVGGKAHTLARLARLDFAVPPGLAVPVECHRHWLQAGGLAAELQAAAARPAAERGMALEALHARLKRVPPPDAVQAALRAALAGAPWAGRPLAVRSSSPWEDSAGASFAGIHASVLNVQGEPALWAALIEVWASTWTPTAVAYRERLGLGHADAATAMAVLVMPLVPATAAGIGFTIDPHGGRADRLLIHAAWGLGESLVGGRTAGDEIELALDAVTDRLVPHACRVGHKGVASRPQAGGGTAIVAAEAAEADTRVLSDDQALRLGRQLRLAALALDYTRPAIDAEWAFDGERFWLLQARPVTAAARWTYPALRRQPDWWTRGNARDVVPHPLSPMDWTGTAAAVDLLLESGMKLAGFPVQPGLQRAKLFDGRLYLNASLMQWEGWAPFGVAPALLNAMLGGSQPAIEVAPATWRDRLRALRSKLRYGAGRRRMQQRGRAQIEATFAAARAWRQELAGPLATDPAGLVQRLCDQRALLMDHDGLHFLQGSGGAFMTMLVDLLEARAPGEGHGLAAALLAGGERSVTAEQAYALTALAQQAMADDAVRPLVTRLAASGDGETASDPLASLPAGHPFRAAFADYLARYGHRGVYESYFRSPRWRERPHAVLASLPALADADLAALEARQRAARAQALARVRQVVPWWQRRWLSMLAREARTETALREAARSALAVCGEASRLTMLALGRCWVARGWLAGPEEVFLLLGPEVVAVVAGERPGEALRPLAAQRRRLMAAWQATEPPDVVAEWPAGVDPRAAAAAGPAVAAPPADASDGDVLAGLAVGSGRGEGPACLLHSPADGHRLAPGAVLVAPSTDPAWTPLFLRAGGLVMETGGTLSHGAIVAREFGIPAVVNVAGAMTRLEDGERLVVDSRAGTVTRHRGR